MNDDYANPEAGTPVCPLCRKPLVFAVEAGYEYNDWVAYCRAHGCVHPDAADRHILRGHG